MNPSVFSDSFVVNLPNDVLEMFTRVVGQTSRPLNKLLCTLHDLSTHHLRIDAATRSAPTLNEVTRYLSKLPNLSNIHLLNSNDIEMGSLLVERAGLTRLVVDNNGSGEPPDPRRGPLAAEALASCLDLRCLALRNIQWTALGSLMALSSLSHVSLSRIEDIKDIGPLSACSTLVSLTFIRCFGITDWEPLSAMTGLTSFTLVHPSHNFTVSPFAALTNHPSLLDAIFIAHIDESDLEIPVDYSPIGTCSKLQKLRFQSFLEHEIGWIGQLTALTSLDLRECWDLISLKALSTCSSLCRLDVRGCRSLPSDPSSFTCLEACAQLSTLLFGVGVEPIISLSDIEFDDDAGDDDDLFLTF
jgi:hypothetical protein